MGAKYSPVEIAFRSRKQRPHTLFERYQINFTSAVPKIVENWTHSKNFWTRWWTGCYSSLRGHIARVHDRSTCSWRIRRWWGSQRSSIQKNSPRETTWRGSRSSWIRLRAEEEWRSCLHKSNCVDNRMESYNWKLFPCDHSPRNMLCYSSVQILKAARYEPDQTDT